MQARILRRVAGICQVRKNFAAAFQDLLTTAPGAPGSSSLSRMAYDFSNFYPGIEISSQSGRITAGMTANPGVPQ